MDHGCLDFWHSRMLLLTVKDAQQSLFIIKISIFIKT